MKGYIKSGANAGYAWMEANPATSILVSFVVSGTLTAAAILGLGLYSNATYVQKTACTRDPASRACAEVGQAVARAEPIKNPCISYQRVTDRRGRNCPRRYVHRAHRRDGGTPVHESGDRGGGDASQTGSTGHQHPGPHGGGGHQEGGVGGGSHPSHPGKGGGAVKPPPDAPGGTSSPPDSTAPGRSGEAPKAEPSLPETVEATGKAAGEVLGQAGGAVQGTVEGMGDAGCKVLGRCQ